MDQKITLALDNTSEEITQEETLKFFELLRKSVVSGTFKAGPWGGNEDYPAGVLVVIDPQELKSL